MAYGLRIQTSTGLTLMDVNEETMFWAGGAEIALSAGATQDVTLDNPITTNSVSQEMSDEYFGGATSSYINSTTRRITNNSSEPITVIVNYWNRGDAF